eukprot:643951-Rhodomonas_salina.1
MRWAEQEGMMLNHMDLSDAEVGSAPSQCAAASDISKRAGLTHGLEQQTLYFKELNEQRRSESRVWVEGRGSRVEGRGSRVEGR